MRVARLDEIPEGTGLRIRAQLEDREIEVGLYRVEGLVYAMEDVCPHAGYPLSRGRLEGCVIECEAHGWPFDVRTGHDPKHADGFPIPCFAVRIVGEEVEIDLTNQTNGRRRRSPAED